MSKRNRNQNTISFIELRTKEVINSTDGKRFGRIIDIVFGSHGGHILGIVVPPARRNIIFRSNEPIFIPWDCVEKIGEDIIIVHLTHTWIDRPYRGSRHGMGMRDAAVIASLDESMAFDEADTSALEEAYIQQELMQDEPNRGSSNNHRPSDNTDFRQSENHNFMASESFGSRASENSNSRQSDRPPHSRSSQNDPRDSNTSSRINTRGQDNPPSRNSKIASNTPKSYEPKGTPDVNNPNFRPGIDCDNKCSKCMLFDCSYRWNDN